MSKIFNVKLSVPSGSRPSAFVAWLNKLLAPHNMTCDEVVDSQFPTAVALRSTDSPEVKPDRYGILCEMLPYRSSPGHLFSENPPVDLRMHTTTFETLEGVRLEERILKHQNLPFKMKIVTIQEIEP